MFQLQWSVLSDRQEDARVHSLASANPTVTTNNQCCYARTRRTVKHHHFQNGLHRRYAGQTTQLANMSTSIDPKFVEITAQTSLNYFFISKTSRTLRTVPNVPTIVMVEGRGGERVHSLTRANPTFTTNNQCCYARTHAHRVKRDQQGGAHSFHAPAVY